MTVDGDSPAHLLDAAINRYIVESEVARIRLYRLKLQIGLKRISPLAINLAAQGAFGLDDVARRLRPPPSWPWRDPATGRGCGVDRRWSPIGGPIGSHGVAASVHRDWPRLGHGAARMRPAADRRGELAYVVSGNVLEAVSRIGDCILQTDQGIGRILLDDELPETLVAALPRRPLDDLFEHPVLSGRGYVIERVDQSRSGRPHIVTFRTGLLPHSMPWSAYLDADPVPEFSALRA